MNLKSNIKTILETQERIISFEEFKKKVRIKDNAVRLVEVYNEIKKERNHNGFYQTLLNPDNKFECILVLYEEFNWYDGIWEDGVWKWGSWYNGTWKGGTWKGGYWYDGVWEKGSWEDGVWRGGEIYLPELKNYYMSPQKIPPTEKNIKFLTSYYRMKRDEA